MHDHLPAIGQENPGQPDFIGSFFRGIAGDGDLIAGFERFVGPSIAAQTRGAARDGMPILDASAVGYIEVDERMRIAPVDLSNGRL